MKRRTFIKKTGAAGLIAFIAPAEPTQQFQPDIALILEQNFRIPPATSYPRVFWFWMNGNVTKKGITLDLEAMKRVGIGGVFNFDVGTGIPKGPIEYLSNEWLELKKHAMQEAGRLGLDFTMHNCPGWSASGGPWITPELAMQQITWSETYVGGGKKIKIVLRKPPIRLNYYHDIATLAFPSMEGEEILEGIRLTASSGDIDENIAVGTEEGMAVYPLADGKPAWLQFEFSQSYEARQITFYIASAEKDQSISGPIEFGERTSIALEASDDGNNFRVVTNINTGLETELMLNDKFITYDFPATKAKYFRLSSAKARRYKYVQFSGFTRLKNWMEKTNHRARYNMLVSEASTIRQRNDQLVPKGSVIDEASVIDLANYVDNDGLLTWDAPPGDWTILRVGFTPTGTYIRAAPESGLGLECDKYNADAMSFHFLKMTEKLLPVMKPLAAKGKMGLEIDSYEAGTQNWSMGFEKLFKNRWGYNLLKYLPALAGGRVVQSVDITERFLWDFRWLQASLIAENYYGRFQKLCHQHKITAYIEPYEMGPMEEMQIGSKGDVNIGEFWSGFASVLPVKQPARRSIKLAASIAHINDQKITGAEAFTAEPESGRWQEYPFALKALGDKAFTKGTNMMIIHRYAHQPHPTALPGMTMGPWGIHFERTNTWWDQGKEWLTYLSRCQYLLRQGHFVGDIIYFTGEDANMYTSVNAEDLNPVPPAGYDYDLVNAEIILKKVKVVNNRLVLANGSSYRIFVLQDYNAVSLALLQKLRQLINDGLIMVGARPKQSTGLSEFGSDDAAFNKIVADLWGGVDEKMITENSYGKGRVFWGMPIQSILEKLNVKKDFEVTSRSGDAPIIYLHRRLPDQDIYFLSNQRRTYEDTVCTFRVAGKQPELWDAVAGTISRPGVYELVDDRVRMPIHFEPYGSVFVVFRSVASRNHIHSVERDNSVVLTTNDFAVTPRHIYSDVANNFTICFWAKPEMNVLLNPTFVMGTVKEPWTEFYAIYPTSGKELFGDAHSCCGVAVGRNGIAIWEHSSGNPVLVLAVPVNVSGWSHVTLVYKNGIPAAYINGILIQTGKKSDNTVHPPSDKAYLKEGASYYNGDMSKPSVFTKSLGDDEIVRLSKEKPPIERSPFFVQMAGNNRPSLLIKSNGNYVLNRNNGTKTMFAIKNIEDPLAITGPWTVKFPANAGVSPQIVMPQLMSLHEHEDAFIKYFSGTAIYSTSFTFPGKVDNKLWYLDLGRVEVISGISMNGRSLGSAWKRPYSVNATSALIHGTNKIEIKVTTLWPNRLIGDEQMPDPDKFSPGGGISGLDSVTKGNIETLPEWYIEGKPKPDNGRVCFTTWKHYTKDSPLLESGLIGPVSLHPAVIKPL